MHRISHLQTESCEFDVGFPRAHYWRGGNVTAKSTYFSQNSRAKLTGAAATDPPLSPAAEYGEAVLTAHVLGCKRCLAAVLFCDETLAHVGCRQYKSLFARMLSLLGTSDGTEHRDHVDTETLEEYCFNRLPETESLAMERHIQVCSRCAQDLAHRREFIACMKDAFNFVGEERAPHGSRAARPVFGRKLALTM
jgi:hypothetical protein